jgi:hypothetical protein
MKEGAPMKPEVAEAPSVELEEDGNACVVRVCGRSYRFVKDALGMVIPDPATIKPEEGRPGREEYVKASVLAKGTLKAPPSRQDAVRATKQAQRLHAYVPTSPSRPKDGSAADLVHMKRVLYAARRHGDGNSGASHD